jgi:hypothetical protein
MFAASPPTTFVFDLFEAARDRRAELLGTRPSNLPSPSYAWPGFCSPIDIIDVCSAALEALLAA